MSTILVTGATGHLGSEVVRQLLEREHSVRAYTRQPHPSVPAGMQVYQGDIREGSGLDEATKGVDAIIHCATLFEPGFTTDLEGSRHLIEAAKANGSPHLVYISIAGIDHSPFSLWAENPVSQVKLSVEHTIEQSGLPWSIVRATQFHYLVLGLITSGEDEKTSTITIPAGSRFQSIDISEVAQTLVTLAEQGAAGRVPDIGGPEVLTLEEMTQTYQGIFHKHNVVRSEPAEVLSGEFYDACRSDDKLVPDRAVGRITWESFLQQQT
ncbi:SDR family oxidoreductase [Ktedonobacter racemifer]|uniref:NAD-dependent epimerase/dehydratase n=1 Tax=Ktedonobacter racemifer DSM 44963 TaxID=485913 RepID=D6TI05_KTERA|nr:NAD(P)H-binding protein [Ktedonobacter racemifer]EFH90975.1 NAD-dependent epimerase/dehydratase [Ktedonobacter racemifer DSM 44963]